MLALALFMILQMGDLLVAVEARKSAKSAGSKPVATGESAVETITHREFETKVVQSDEPWLLEFYAPWCGHCKRLEPIFESTATALKGDVRVGKVDGPDNLALMLRFGVSGFPSIFAIRDKKTYVFNGHRTQVMLERFALNPAEHGEAMSTLADPLGPVGRAKGAVAGVGMRVMDAHDHIQREFKLSNSLAWFVVFFLSFLAVIVATMMASGIFFFLGEGNKSGLHSDPAAQAPPRRPHQD
ncbi:Protein disulfide-isomerase [Hondaea fermentalgiana]|uniref:Protein disulfide-isomerase n=1 Tax=Hondaea fermentalgiana TaxID=2315210 RepID=A0A2R5GGV9_9STRA|nr:Protein disulfide-isomerase [Hondaea fermentalgiana]|eukprot:GBG30122.1 Protein disulfide-isomerase [Hondaea fermentalgiana]